MATVAELIVLLERAVGRLVQEAARARKTGAQVEGLRGQADAFLLLAYELREHGDPASLLDSLYDMERAAAWTARLDEEQAAEFRSRGNASASRYHAKSARYSHGLMEGYSRARVLLSTWSPQGDSLTGT